MCLGHTVVNLLNTVQAYIVMSHGLPENDRLEQIGIKCHALFNADLVIPM